MIIIGIYEIRCKITGRVYVGQSNDVKGRLRTHKRLLRQNKHENKYLQNHVNKYGIENVEFELIEECLQCDLNDREVYWIKEFGSMARDKGFNLESGGNAGKTYSKERIEAITGAGNPMFGRKQSPEMVEFMRLVNRGSSDKLTINDVREIKMALILNIVPQELVTIFKVDITTINKIARCTNWEWVLPELNDELMSKRDMEREKREKKIFELWEKGHRVINIAKMLQCDSKIVSNVLKKELEKKEAERLNLHDLVREEFMKGTQKAEIIKMFGISKTTYNRITSSAHNQKKQELIKKVFELKYQGHLNKEIAEMLGLHRGTVTEYLKNELDPETMQRLRSTGKKGTPLKLNEEKVIEIKRMLKLGIYSHQEIGDMFGVTESSISQIKRGVRWSHVEVPPELRVIEHRSISTKLNEKKVIEIKILLQEGNYLHKQIAEMYGVSRATITDINTGKRWSHVKIPLELHSSDKV
ncbi:GIY-YIG nuclease family protein [Priestia sp. FSL R5-0680]|uniref:GIY-YIG nuclease family protein n=1 Tax=Priestia sp. FSL R5-0680 TaxID=2921582 RepID=UPI0030FC2972